MIKNLFKDPIEYIPSQVVPILVGIFSLPIFTRIFPPADYGNYSLVMATISILSTLTGWVGMSIIRFYPAYEKENRIEELKSESIKLTFLSILIISIIFLFLLSAFHKHIPQLLHNLLVIGIIVFILMTLFTTLLTILRIKRKIKLYSAFFSWKSIAALLFGLIFVILFNFSADGLLWGIAVSICLALPVLWKTALGKFHIKRLKISNQVFKEMSKYSFPLVIGNLAAWVLSLSDRYLLQIFRGSQEVGIYSVSYKISEYSILFLAALFALSFNPLAITIWEKHGEQASQEFLTKGTRYFLMLCVPAVVGVSVLRNPILKILSTPDYYQGSKIIPFVALGGLFFGLNQRFGMGLAFYKKTKYFMYSLIISGLVNLILNILLIPKFGYIAAAVTTLVSYMVLTLLTFVFSRKYFTWEFPFTSLLKIIFASGLMSIAVYYIGSILTSITLWSLVLIIASGMLVYLSILFLLKEFKAIEIQELLRLKRKFLRKDIIE